MSKLKPKTREKLKKISTATLTTALFKRGLHHQMIQDVHPLNPSALPMVGEAFTLRYIPAREDLNKIEVFQDRKHPQRAAIEECPPERFCSEVCCRRRTVPEFREIVAFENVQNFDQRDST